MENLCGQVVTTAKALGTNGWVKISRRKKKQQKNMADDFFIQGLYSDIRWQQQNGKRKTNDIGISSFLGTPIPALLFLSWTCQPRLLTI